MATCKHCGTWGIPPEDIKQEPTQERKQRQEREAKTLEKDKLIEQMRAALEILVASATPSGPLWHGSAEMQIARAALKAAERGE